MLLKDILKKIEKNPEAFLKDKKENYYTYVEIKNNKLKVFPAGGGLLISKHPEDIKEITNNLPKHNIKTFAYIDEPDKKWACVCNTHALWNGWYIPLFKLKEVKSILEHFNLTVAPNESLHTQSRISIKNNYTEEIETLNHKDGFYTFDGWCWDITNK